jgi:nitrogen regulatory protein PII-like uncharacterized protein
MAHPIAFNVQRLIAEVAAQYRLLLKPDDAAFALVTMNRLVPEESLEAIRSRVAADLAQFKASAQWAHKRAESAIAEEVRRSTAALRDEIQRDINTARLRSVEIVQEVKTACQQPMSNQKFTIVVLAALLLLLCGIWVRKVTASWWPI